MSRQSPERNPPVSERAPLRRIWLGRVNTAQRFDDQGEEDKADKDDIKFLEPREDSCRFMNPRLQLAGSLGYKAAFATHRNKVYEGGW
jgi:hypothetical protein